jgi:hypothetical protein
VTDLETAIGATLKRGAPSRGRVPQCPMQYWALGLRRGLAAATGPIRSSAG